MIVEPKVGKDASDHLGAGHSVADFVQVWPLPENLLEHDPKRFKQLMLRRALEVPDDALAWTERHADYKPKPQPLYETGLKGLTRSLHFQGCVVVSGPPSAAKSYLALGCGIDNAIAGWDVFLLKCEMAETVARDRAARAVASHDLEQFDAHSVQALAESLKRSVPELPERYHIVNVNIGVTIEDVVGWLADHVTERPTLVILDSISSFIDNMAVDANDAFGMAQLREVTRYTTGVSELTHGHVAWLLLSEMNKENRPKGRSLDYRCDIAIAMVSGEDEGHEHVKDIRITKNWHGPTGRLGSFVHWWQVARLCRVEDAPL
jgi:predicted ATP-dependent serine protease